MELKGIKYIGPVFDASGYGQASRGYVLALDKLNAPLMVRPVSFEAALPDLSGDNIILNKLIDREIDYNVVILHMTPEFAAQHVENGKTNIEYVVWETSKLHPAWLDYINNNNIDAVMVGCDWNVEVFKSSGIKKPVFAVPHGIETSEYDNIEPYDIEGIKKDAYKFYDIFQFTERKNPAALIKSYWAAFQNDENVALILKTYKGDFSDMEKDAVRDTIKRLKDVAPLDKYPPVYLILDMLSRKEILGLHKAGDCFVSLNRFEGFGLNPFEAGAAGNPIMVTGGGGVLEYAKPQHSYLVDYSLTPVFGMKWSPWYRGDQMWAEPNCGHAIELMRYVYDNQDEARKRGVALKKYIAENLSWEKVGQKMLDVIKEVK